MIIGIDVGGTHTDGVLLDKRTKQIIVACKERSTDLPGQGVERAILSLLEKAKVPATEISEVYLGTTYATNAILQGKGLSRVGVIRIAGQRPHLPPAYRWPKILQQYVVGCETIAGGFEYDGDPITPFSRKEALEAIERLLARGAEAIAVTGVFSSMKPEQEEQVGELITDVPYTLSHSLGSIGFIERENGAILNSALKNVVKKGFADFQKIIHGIGIFAPLMMTQNRGSMIDLEEAMASPILTVSSGPINSFVGAAKLAGLENAIVVDIGGTSTDIGVVINGFPRQSLNQTTIGGVPLHFPLPDVISVALGGGSHVSLGPQCEIGPNSVGRSLRERAIAFGGEVLTLTDIALRAGHLHIPNADSSRVALTVEKAKETTRQVVRRISSLISQIEAGRSDLPVILVGGGASLLSVDDLPERFRIPNHYASANAYGAALTEITSTVDRVVSLKEETLDLLKQEAIDQVIAKGAHPSSVRIADIETVPLYYMPGSFARIFIVAAG